MFSRVSIFSGSVMHSYLSLSEASDESEVSPREKNSLLEYNALIIQLINCWKPAAKAQDSAITLKCADDLNFDRNGTRREKKT